MMIRMAELEKLFQSLPLDIANIKTLFERNNLTINAMDEHTADQIVALVDKIDDLDTTGDDIDSIETIDKVHYLQVSRDSRT